MKKHIKLLIVLSSIIFCSTNSFTQNSYVEKEIRIIKEATKERGYFLVHQSSGKIKNRRSLESRMFTVDYGGRVFVAAIVEDCNQCSTSIKHIHHTRIYKPWNYPDLKAQKDYKSKGDFTVLTYAEKFKKIRQSSTGTIALFNHSKQKRKVI